MLRKELNRLNQATNLKEMKGLNYTENDIYSRNGERYAMYLRGNNLIMERVSQGDAVELIACHDDFKQQLRDADIDIEDVMMLDKDERFELIYDTFMS
jgi:hypothetical protein